MAYNIHSLNPLTDKEATLSTYFCMSGNGCVNQFTPITPIIPSFSETYLITSLLDLNEKTPLSGTALANQT
jgi:hypothetical protein